MKYVMAIDIGTGSGRAVIFDDGGKQIAAAQQEWWHQEDARYPGSMNFDVEGNWRIICACIQQALAKADLDGADIAAVAVSSMREAIICYDQQGREIWACANVDSRAVAEVRDLLATQGALERELYRQSGQTFALGALPRLLWIKNHEPDIFARIAKISMLSDWVAYRLCGELAVDASNAGTTGLLALDSRDWLAKPLQDIGLDAGVCPPVLATGTVLGTVGADAAAQSGLSENTRVCVGGGDCQIGTLGLGLTDAGQCAVLGGTFWQQIVNVPPGIGDAKMDLRINPHVVPGLNQMEAISFFVGAAARWLRDALAPDLVAKVRDPGDAYPLLEALGADVPAGSYGILPIFSDEMHYGRWMHAAPSFLNLGLDASKYHRGALFKALQENACVVATRNLERIFALAGVRPAQIVFAAGASKSPRWSQMLADASGLPVVVPVVQEASSLGCAMAAAEGAGWVSSARELARDWVGIARRHEPDVARKALYDELGKQWAAAYAAQLALVHQGVTTAMWKAPGL